jgi:hypothetical protein
VEAQHRRHREQKQRQGKRRADPQAPLQVLQFGIVGRGYAANRHQSHAAFRAVARPVLDYFGMHRTGVARARHGRGRCRRMHVLMCMLIRAATAGGRLGKVFPGFGLELGQAAGTAEGIARALVFEDVLGGGRINLHPAYRIRRCRPAGLFHGAHTLDLPIMGRSSWHAQQPC